MPRVQDSPLSGWRASSRPRLRYCTVAVNVTDPAPSEEAVTVCAPVPEPRVHSPEIAMPDGSVRGVVGFANTPPPVATTYETMAPTIRFPAASRTLVQSGSLSWDPAVPD